MKLKIPGLGSDKGPAFQGHIDSVDATRIEGWIWERGQPDKKVLVLLRLQDGRVLRAVADMHRQDLADAGIGRGTHGFVFRFPMLSAIEQTNGKVSIEVEGQAFTLTADTGIPDPAPKVMAPTPPKDLPQGMIGAIDEIKAGRAFCRLVSGKTPVLLCGGRPSAMVSHSLAQSGEGTELYEFDLGDAPEGTVLELLAADEGGLTGVQESVVKNGQVSMRFLDQLATATNLARQGAVGLVAWDASRSEIRRAISLANALAGSLPVVVLAYVFKSRGNGVWGPLRAAGVPVLTVPWEDRGSYERAMRASGLAFDTLWIANPLLPAFKLAQIASHGQTRLILDEDGNSEAVGRDMDAMRAAHGPASQPLANALAGRIVARTVAATSFAGEGGAVLVRDTYPTRQTAPEKRPVRKNAELLFLGDVEPETDLADLARRAGRIEGRRLSVVACGDIHPAHLTQELKDAGTQIVPALSRDALADRLKASDAVLAPAGAKALPTISAALSAGKPVLARRERATEALEGITGVYLYPPEAFERVLETALDSETPIPLPEEFSCDAAFDAFRGVELTAGQAPRAGEVFAGLLPRIDAISTAPTLLLVWKQADGGVYGRRVDQIARSYKRENPRSRVVVLDITSNVYLRDLAADRAAFTSDNGLIWNTLAARKNRRQAVSGVEYVTLGYDDPAALAQSAEAFLVREDILPSNTVAILFPTLTESARLWGVFRPFPKIVDVVDNEFGWTPKAEWSRLFADYGSAMRLGAPVVFNSERTRAAFEENGLLAGASTHSIIENWYTLPDEWLASAPEPKRPGPKDIVYSGNMTARIDWDLVEKVLSADPSLRLHLIGAAPDSAEAFWRLIGTERVIYHGPLSEIETLDLLGVMRLALVPHKVDDVSAYMNPLKVQMYQAVGLPALAMRVPGLSSGPLCRVVDTHDAFLAALAEMLGGTAEPHGDTFEADLSRAVAYATLIDGLRQHMQPKPGGHD